MNIGSAIKNFATRNLSTRDDFGSVEGNRQEAKRVDTEVGRINSDTVDIQGKLETLKEDSKLAPPTFSAVSNKQVLMGTTAAGAVVGGTVGVLSNLAGGGSEVSIHEKVIPIVEQQIDGAGFDRRRRGKRQKLMIWNRTRIEVDAEGVFVVAKDLRQSHFQLIMAKNRSP